MVLELNKIIPYSVYNYERMWLCRMNLNSRPKLKLCFNSQWVRR